MKLETYGKRFGQLCHEFRLPFSGSPHQVPWVGSRPDTGGTLGHNPSSLPFVCCSTLPREQTGMAAREVSAFPQPPATHRAERIKGFSWGESNLHGSGTRNSFFLPALGLTEPCPPPDLLGRRSSRGWGHTIWNRFGMEDLRFKGIIFFRSTTVFQVDSHVGLPCHKIDKKSC